MRLRQAAERGNGKAAANAVKRELMRIAARENARAQRAAGAFAFRKKITFKPSVFCDRNGLALLPPRGSCHAHGAAGFLTGAVQLAWMMDYQTHSQGRFSRRWSGDTVSAGHQIDSQRCGPSPGRDFF
jgi:hypothetical protein